MGKSLLYDRIPSIFGVYQLPCDDKFYLSYSIGIMISVEQWRAAIGCFSPTRLHCAAFTAHGEVVNTSALMMYWLLMQCFGTAVRLLHNLYCSKMLYRLEYLIPQTLMLLLLLCGDIETNPGPVCQKCFNVICSCLHNVTPKRQPARVQSRRKQCPVCSSLLGCRKAVCGCGYNFAKGIVEQSVRSQKEQKRQAMASLRANASPQNTLKRKQSDQLAHVLRRANESPEVTLKRKQSDQLAHVLQRANESPEVTLKRKQSDQLAHVLQRANESPEVTLRRNEQNRVCMASLRIGLSAEIVAKQNLESKFRMASLRANQSPEVSEQCRAQNRLHMSANRNKQLSIDEAVCIFFMGIKEGPDCVCTVCHRMMYRLGVCPYNRLNYHKCSADMLQTVFSMEYVCSDGSQWICRTCNIQLKRGSLPVQAKANGLALNVVPCELSDLKPWN